MLVSRKYFLFEMEEYDYISIPNIEYDYISIPNKQFTLKLFVFAVLLQAFHSWIKINVLNI